MVIEERVNRGSKIIKNIFLYIDWDAVASVIVVIIFSPIWVPWCTFCWIVGFCSEKREERREGIRTVKD